MKTFEKNITVVTDDLDELNHVNNVRYVKWVNDIAKEHWLLLASENILENYFWVALSHHIEYKSAAILDDVIKIKTYVLKSEGVTSTRIVEMYHSETNKLVAKSETNWCFVNSQTKRPTRIIQEIIDLFH